MSEIVRIAPDEVVPRAWRVRRALGLPAEADESEGANRASDPRTSALLADAMEIVREIAEPAGIWKEVTPGRFAAIYRGSGANAPESPLAGIFPKAERLALFAVTIGGKVGGRIAELFQSRDLALAAILDAAASEAAERAAEVLEQRWEEAWDAHRKGHGEEGGKERGEMRGQEHGEEPGARPGEEPTSARSWCAMRYSPGYCGWDVTGQRALFAELGPEAIGIRLGESCLMSPLKSISGVMVLGRPEIHSFAAAYPFCGACRSRDCVDRGRKTAAR